MHDALYEYITTEIKNHIHDEILWRVRGTLLNNEEILKEIYSDGMISPKSIFLNAKSYLPKDYKLNSETVKPVLEYSKPANIKKLPSFEEYTVQTLKRLDEELIEEQKTWVQKTDFDRLFLAVKELKVQGILFNYYDDMKGAMLRSKVERLIREGDDVKGYFYTSDQGIEYAVQKSSYLKKRFLSHNFNDHAYDIEDAYTGLSLSSRSCKAELGSLSFVRTDEELEEHHRMATIIAEKLNEHNLSATVSDDGLSLHTDTFDWKLRRGKGSSAAQVEAEQDMAADY